MFSRSTTKDKESQIESLTDTKVFGTRLEERVLRGLGGLAGTKGCSGGLLTGSGLGLGRLVIETRLRKQSVTTIHREVR